ncbi:HutD family protein [Geothrix sp.]|jgi:environmental stress-induced protein Ves|uniref:HutD/Ves family protein n=1 Tax=Geothrix sp. TaxID=1962974 RepID=UPI0025B7DAEC|nr:HutD family protein [Geothrix sp.]
MDWIHLKPADGRLMPWKNGGGRTLEILVDPPGAAVDSGFGWRLSTAEVAVSGPFSAFPGLERTLLLLEGAGFTLDLGPRGWAEVRDPLVPFVFSGDWPVSASLVDGPCTDFNVMADPRRCRARVEAFSLEVPRRLDLGAATVAIFVARGTVSVPALGLHLGQRHTLRIDVDVDAGANARAGVGPGVRLLALAPGLGGASLVVVRVDPRA